MGGLDSVNSGRKRHDMSQREYPATDKEVSEVMLDCLLEAEGAVDTDMALCVIRVGKNGAVRPEIFYKEGGRFNLLVGMDLARADLIDMIRSSSCNPKKDESNEQRR